jgi:hypothetical protein
MPILLLHAACLAVLLGAPLESVSPQGNGPFNFGLSDQLGHRCAVSDHFGDVFVMIYGDKQILEVDRRAQDRLTAAFLAGRRSERPEADAPKVKPVEGAPPGSYSPQVHVASVACLQGYPNPAVQSLVRRQFATRWPHSVVLIDFEDKMRQNFGLTAGTSHVLVFDTYGRLRLRMTGELDDASLAALVRGIEELRKEAVFQNR